MNKHDRSQQKTQTIPTASPPRLAKQPIKKFTKWIEHFYRLALDFYATLTRFELTGKWQGKTLQSLGTGLSSKRESILVIRVLKCLTVENVK